MARFDRRVYIGDTLRALRTAAVPPMTQKQLAERANLHRTVVVAIENNKRSVGAEVAGRLAEALGVTVDALLPPAAVGLHVARSDDVRLDEILGELTGVRAGDEPLAVLAEGLALLADRVRLAEKRLDRKDLGANQA